MVESPVTVTVRAACQTPTAHQESRAGVRHRCWGITGAHAPHVRFSSTQRLVWSPLAPTTASRPTALLALPRHITTQRLKQFCVRCCAEVTRVPTNPSLAISTHWAAEAPAHSALAPSPRQLHSATGRIHLCLCYVVTQSEDPCVRSA